MLRKIINKFVDRLFTLIKCRTWIFAGIVICLLFYYLQLYSKSEIEVRLTNNDDIRQTVQLTDTDTRQICQEVLQRLGDSKPDSEKACSRYFLNNNDICKGIKYGFTLIIVDSEPLHFRERVFMRKTIGNYSILPGWVRVVFNVGGIQSGSLQTDLVKEHNTYSDIIQGNYDEHSAIHLQKEVFDMKWTIENCHKAQYVIKMKDNVTADIFYLLINILAFNIGSKSIFYCEGRQQLEKYRYVEFQWYSGDKAVTQPWEQCVAGAIILTRDLIPALYSAWTKQTVKGMVNIIPHVPTDSTPCHLKSRCLFQQGSHSTLVDFWNKVYDRRYEFIDKAFDNVEIMEGF